MEKFIGKNSDTYEGFNPIKTLSLKKKLIPKNNIEPPTAKCDRNGNLVTSKVELEKLYLQTYIDRLTPNPIKHELEELFILKSILFDIRIEQSKSEVTNDWSMDDLEKVLKTLKNGKARDAHGHMYELFKDSGNELKLSQLKLFTP